MKTELNEVPVVMTFLGPGAGRCLSRIPHSKVKVRLLGRTTDSKFVLPPLNNTTEAWFYVAIGHPDNIMVAFDGDNRYAYVKVELEDSGGTRRTVVTARTTRYTWEPLNVADRTVLLRIVSDEKNYREWV